MQDDVSSSLQDALAARCSASAKSILLRQSLDAGSISSRSSTCIQWSENRWLTTPSNAPSYLDTAGSLALMPLRARQIATKFRSNADVSLTTRRARVVTL
jgi:hypothetical protein